MYYMDFDTYFFYSYNFNIFVYLYRIYIIFRIVLYIPTIDLAKVGEKKEVKSEDCFGNGVERIKDNRITTERRSEMQVSKKFVRLYKCNFDNSDGHRN